MTLLNVLKIILLNGVFYLIWKIFFNYNRFPVLGRFWLIASAVLPLLLVNINNLAAVSITFSFPRVNVSAARAVENVQFPVFMYIYLIISVLLLFVLLVSAIRIFFLKRNCKVFLTYGSVRIYEGKVIKRPFSFGKSVFIPEGLQDKLRDIVIRHELAHIRQLHYLDLWLMQFLLTFMWFNPFLWMIKSDMKLLHELLADRETIKYVPVEDYINALAFFSGFSFTPVINLFAAVRLKRRLSFIIHFKPQKLGAMRILFAAVAFMLATSLAFAHVDPAGVPTTLSDTVRPEFPGGQKALISFLSQHLVYPEKARQNKWQDVVIVEFTVNQNGKVQNPRVIKGKYPVLNSEALRVVRLLPDFKPATVSGEPVSAKVRLPIVFRLDE